MLVMKPEMPPAVSACTVSASRSFAAPTARAPCQVPTKPLAGAAAVTWAWAKPAFAAKHRIPRVRRGRIESLGGNERNLRQGTGREVRRCAPLARERHTAAVVHPTDAF